MFVLYTKSLTLLYNFPFLTSTYCRCHKQTEQAFIVHAVMHILQFWSDMAILQPAFVTKAKPSFPQQTVSEARWKCKTFSSSAESRCLIWEINTLKATEIHHVNSQDGFSWPCCAFKSLLLLWISASVIVMCQNVSSSYPGNTFQRNLLRAPCLCRIGEVLHTHHQENTYF